MELSELRNLLRDVGSVLYTVPSGKAVLPVVVTAQRSSSLTKVAQYSKPVRWHCCCFALENMRHMLDQKY
jgi:hypothetical protein